MIRFRASKSPRVIADNMISFAQVQQAISGREMASEIKTYKTTERKRNKIIFPETSVVSSLRTAVPKHLFLPLKNTAEELNLISTPFTCPSNKVGLENGKYVPKELMLAM